MTLFPRPLVPQMIVAAVMQVVIVPLPTVRIIVV